MNICQAYPRGMAYPKGAISRRSISTFRGRAFAKCDQFACSNDVSASKGWSEGRYQTAQR